MTKKTRQSTHFILSTALFTGFAAIQLLQPDNVVAITHTAPNKKIEIKYNQTPVKHDMKDLQEEKTMIVAFNIEKKKEQFKELLNSQGARNIDLRTPSGANVEEINSMLKDTNLSGLGQAFINAETQYNVNALYLAAHAAWESGWGTSELSMYKNNLYGFTAYDADPTLNARSFQSKEECINIVASYIAQNYLAEGGKYYNGPNLVGMNIQYASDENWANGIANILTSFTNKTGSL